MTGNPEVELRSIGRCDLIRPAWDGRDPEIKAGFKGSFIDTLYEQQHGVHELDVQMSMSYQPSFKNQWGIGARKGDALIPKVNTSLAKLKKDGTLKRIFTKYGIDGALVK